MIHPNAPTREIWNAVSRLWSAPAAMFVVGDKTTYCNLNDGADQAREVFGVDMTRGYSACWTRSGAGDGNATVHDESSIVFCLRGFLHTIPIPDMSRRFPVSVAAATMKREMERIAKTQRHAYQRLKHNVQFIDLEQGFVMSSVRFEADVVCKKRKRNACRQESESPGVDLELT
tara:strand:- start:5548 stop:6069 length:522 start_codon:yes stop_codon:yes gene_type:complete